MKRLIIVLIVCILSGTGCRDFLNVIPKNKKVVSSLEDVRMEMYAFLAMFVDNGAYQTMEYGNKQLLYPMRNDRCTYFTMYSDDIVMSGFLGKTETDPFRDVYFENVNWKGFTLGKGLWDDFYSNIGLLNTILQDANKFRSDGEENYGRITGEARVIRAYYYFKLLQFFAPYDNDKMGVPVNLIQDDIEPKPRSSQSDIYRLIINELNEVLEYSQRATNWNIFYDQEIIHAILAEVYWFKAESAAAEATDWENARKYAANIMANYKVESSAAEYKDVFSSAGVKVVKKHPNVLLKFMNRRSSASGLKTGPWGVDGKVVAVTGNLIKEYDGNDIRLASFFNTKEEGAAQTYCVFKYRYNIDRDGVSEIGVLFRTSEMMLICAEAYARQGKMEEAKKLLVEFKQSKIPGYSDFSGDVLAEILLERRKEFCFENDMRWLDMKRLGASVIRQGMSPDKVELVTYELKADDYRYALPIPEDTELTYSGIEQNPGWGNVNK